MTDKPYYFDHLVGCVKRMLNLRDVSAYLAQNNEKSKIGKRTKGKIKTNDTANNEIIPGNIARLVLTSGSKSYGVEWVGLSPAASSYVKELRKSREPYVSLSIKGKEIAWSVHECEKVGCGGLRCEPEKVCDPKCGQLECRDTTGGKFEPSFSALNSDRESDSEYLLLNFLAHAIDDHSLPPTGALSIISERIPCASCTSVIDQFLKKFPEITLGIFYMHDTANRVPSDFLEEVGDHKICLFKIAIHITTSVISVHGDPKVIIGDMAREQSRMFGGAPNQLHQAIAPSMTIGQSSSSSEQARKSGDAYIGRYSRPRGFRDAPST